MHLLEIFTHQNVHVYVLFFFWQHERLHGLFSHPCVLRNFAWTTWHRRPEIAALSVPACKLQPGSSYDDHCAACGSKEHDVQCVTGDKCMEVPSSTLESFHWTSTHRAKKLQGAVPLPNSDCTSERKQLYMEWKEEWKQTQGFVWPTWQLKWKFSVMTAVLCLLSMHMSLDNGWANDAAVGNYINQRKWKNGYVVFSTVAL